MNRRNFFRRLFVGAAAIAVVPKIIAEVARPETALERGTRIHMEFERILCVVDPCGKHPKNWGRMVVYGTGQNDNDFKWVEPNWMGRYKMIKAKSRRKGFGYHPDQFLPFYEEAGKFHEI